MTTIKEHIEAGRYPVDAKGRALVPMRGGGIAVICATDKPGRHPIVGWIQGSNRSDAWHDENESGGYFLPPPPRKVKVTAYAIVLAGTDDVLRVRLDRPAGVTAGIERLVELTGEYEEPWS